MSRVGVGIGELIGSVHDWSVGNTGDVVAAQLGGVPGVVPVPVEGRSGVGRNL